MRKKHDDKTFLSVRLCVTETMPIEDTVEIADRWEPLENGAHWKPRSSSITRCPNDPARVHVVLDY